MNLLEDPGRFYWKWIAIAVALLVVYAIERTIRTGALI
jgi:hypothetical protein